jgi:hypothetical protein
MRKMYTEDMSIIEKIKIVYPKCIQNNVVDTKILGEFFFANKQNQKIQKARKLLYYHSK